MEENVTQQQIPVLDIVNNNSNSSGGTIPNELKKEELQSALSETISDLENICQNNNGQIMLITIINIILIVGAYCFGKTLYDNTQFEKYWDLRIVYYTSTRILLASAYISLLIFMLNLLRNYLMNSRLNRDKLLVARSMAGLLAAGSGFIERKIVYNKLLDIIISDNQKLNFEKEESMKIHSYETIIELLKEVLKKK